MSRFADVLQQARSRLAVPEPSRSRILLEMASDLEDSYQYYLRQGNEEDEAIRRAEEAFATSDEALNHLVKIHQSSHSGLADRVSDQAGTVWERVLLLALLAFEIWLAIQVLSTSSLFVHVSPFVWPIAGLALAAIGLTIWKLSQIFSSVAGDVRRLRTGLGALLFCAGASLAVATCGFLYHLQRFFRLNANDAPEALFTNFAGWMIEISSLMTLGLLGAILTGLVWYALTRLVSRAERRQVEALLEASI